MGVLSWLGVAGAAHWVFMRCRACGREWRREQQARRSWAGEFACGYERVPIARFVAHWLFLCLSGPQGCLVVPASQSIAMAVLARHAFRTAIGEEFVLRRRRRLDGGAPHAARRTCSEYMRRYSVRGRWPDDVMAADSGGASAAQCPPPHVPESVGRRTRRPYRRR